MRRTGRLSLRGRVAVVAAAVTAGLVIVTAVALAAVLGARETTQLDRRLDAVTAGVAVRVSQLGPGSVPALVGGARDRELLARLAPGLTVTVRQDGAAVATATTSARAVSLPALAPGHADVSVAGLDYRTATVSVAAGTTVTAALPAGGTIAQVRRIRLTALVAGALAVLAAGVLGWAAAGRAVRPLAVLGDRLRTLPPHVADPAGLTSPPVSDSPETLEVGLALTSLLERVATAQAAGDRALATARDFSVAAGHELRTPLTAMRTDLEVLLAHPDLTTVERSEVVVGLLRAQSRVEHTLAALGALAGGSLTDRRLFAPVDLADLVVRAVEDVRAQAAGIRVDVVLPPGEVLVHGSAGGLRLILDNLLVNAVRHGRPGIVTVSVEPSPTGPVLIVDDDGLGIAPAEREAMFGRFVRGPGAAAGGSGLGLALVAAQAEAHDATVWLAQSPGGGTRAAVAFGKSRRPVAGP